MCRSFLFINSFKLNKEDSLIMNKILTFAAAGLLVASGSTFAAAAAAPMAPAYNPWYVGVGINYSSGMTYKVEDQTTNGLKSKLDDQNVGWNLFAGYNITKTTAIEVGYNYFGKTTYKVYDADSSVKPYVKGWALYGDGIWSLPLNQYFKVFAKAGVDYINLESKDAESTTALTLTDRNKLSTFGLNYGAGVQFDYQQFGARLSYTDFQSMTRNQKDNFDVPNLIALDVMYHFG
jgi:opacity protein-like surface antigen